MISYSATLSALAARARALRILRNLRQGDLARMAGLGVATVARFEKSGHASLESALRIAVALGAEGGFDALFAPPRYRTLDEALARPKLRTRQRVRRPRAP